MERRKINNWQNKLRQQCNNLTCMYTNCDYGLSNKLEELEIQIQRKQPDIIAMTEVVPKNIQHIRDEREALIPSYQLKNYVLYHNISTSTGRGICMYVKSSLNANELSCEQDMEENVWVEVKLQNKKVKVGCLYRSPSDNSEETNNQMNNHIKEMSRGSDEFLMTGDFNYPTINWRNNIAVGNKGAKDFLELINDEMLNQHQEDPTRHRGSNEPSTLDLIITKYQDTIMSIDQEPPLGNGDHDVLFIKTNFEVVKGTQKQSKPNLHKGDYDKLRSHMTDNWSVLLNDKNTIQSWNMFRDRITDGINKYIPKFTEKTSKKPVWMNQKTLNMVNKKKEAWKELVKAKREKENVEECEKVYNKARNLSRRATRSTIKQFELNIAKEVKTNPKSFWRHVKQKTKVSSKIADLIDPSTGNKTQCTEEQVDVLNTFFSSVFTDENLAEIPSVEPRINTGTLENIEITEDKVNKRLKNINPNKATGPDNLPGRVLKELHDIIAAPLSIIFQKSLDESLLPEEWLIGEISPIYKNKGAKSDPSNYRPVSLTALVCKNIEDIIREEIIEFFNSINYISPVQYAFVKGRSCVSQVITVLDDWTKTLDEGGNIDVIYTDFKKAYDSVAHQRLLKKVENAGIKGKVLKWIEAFLTNRKQRVKLSDTKSKWANVLSGIPQGTVLGALLFLIFINDLPEHIKNSIIKLFADDAKFYKLIREAEDAAELQQDLNAACDWTIDWQLMFHPDKCKVVRLGKDNKKFNYTIKDQNGVIHPVTESEGEKDLGILIDSKLNFQEHVNKKVKQANSILGIIKRSFKSLNKDSFIPLYKALVRPILEYGQPAWFPLYEREADALEAVQRRATCLILGIKHLPYRERLKYLNLPTLKHRRLRGDMIYTYKILTQQIYTDHEILKLVDENSITRGHKLKITKPKFKTSLRQKFFTNRVVEEWNKLPASVIEAPSINAFKNRFDKLWEDEQIYEYKGH